MLPVPSMPLASDITEEREALEDLLQSKGWRVFESYLAREYQGIGYFQKMNTILEGKTPEEAILLHRTSKELVKAITWPKRRVAELAEAKS